MFKYIFRRVLIFIPTLFAISLVTFFLSVSTPGDPVETMLAGDEESMVLRADNALRQAEYIRLRHKLGLDLPVFYFSLATLAVSDTLYRLPVQSHRKNLKKLAYYYGTWGSIEAYYHSVIYFKSQIESLIDSGVKADELIMLKRAVDELLISNNQVDIVRFFELINIILYSIETEQNESVLFGAHQEKLKNSFEQVQDKYFTILRKGKSIKRFIPTIHFHGFKNQYHKWITRFLSGNMGISYQDGRPVSSIIWGRVKVTLLISILAMFLTYLISIPLGVRSAAKKGKFQDSLISTTLFTLYSLPNFWIATMLIAFLACGDYLCWFPPYGLGEITDSMSIGQRISETALHLILPLICWVYPALAFLSRQMRGGMINVLNQDYIRTARAKGLNERRVLWSHSFRNALLPIITLIANVFPMMIAGSVVLEIIFSIPGMGKLFFDSILSQNYPIIFAVVMFSAFLTGIGYLVGDILYVLADPRISLARTKPKITSE
ncbi:MAG: ABC transporter permease [Bacteroidetes bacterium]|nr:ABC transporter permease [Bacteroidota bacterium]